MYTTTTISVTQALVSGKECSDILSFMHRNCHLEEIEILGAYTTGASNSSRLVKKMWSKMLQHASVRSISLHNTNCVPTGAYSSRKQSVASGTRLVDLRITFCNMNMEGIAWLSVNFTHDTCLQKLVLSDNKLCDSSIHALCGIFETNRTITYLDISNNTFGHQGICDICHMLGSDGSTNGLKTLATESNRFRDAGAALLAQTLQHNTQLCVLNVKNNMVGPGGITSLITMLSQNTTLHTLSLANNCIDGAAQTLLHSTLQKYNKTLRSLDVSMLWDDGTVGASSPNVDPAWISRVATVEPVALLQACRCIHYLRLDGIHTSLQDMHKMGALLEKNTALRQISLVACGLTPESIRPLIWGIRGNTTVEQIDLSDNNMCGRLDHESKQRVLNAEFWGVLSENKSLQVLQLRGNALGTQSMFHGSIFLAQHTTLKILDVSNNEIGSIGALAMLHALAKNTVLRILDMTQNASFPLSFSRLLSNIVKRRICSQGHASLHVHGIALSVTLLEMRCFAQTRLHPGVKITKFDILDSWTKACQARKEAFLLLTCPRLCSGTLCTLSMDALRIILAFNILPD